MPLPKLKPVNVHQATTLTDIKAEILFVFASEQDIKDQKINSPELQDLDRQFLQGLLSRLVTEENHFKGKWLQTASSLMEAGHNIRRIVLIGTGSKIEEAPAKLRQLGLKTAEMTLAFEASTVAVVAKNHFSNTTNDLYLLPVGFRMGIYKYPNPNTTDTEEAKRLNPISLHLVFEQPLGDAFERAALFGEALDLCRLLQDGPPNVVTPKYVSQEIAGRAQDAGLKVTVFGSQKLKELGFGALLAVSGGSGQEPQFIVVDYTPENVPKEELKTLALVGKGITMDTGGYSLKTPSTNQEGMKYDMSGAAVALSSVLTIAKLRLPLRVVGVAALCENMVDAHAYRVNDIIRGYSGKTIEILNTDAEGRIILSDALSYTAKNLDPNWIVEFSTLTGAMLVTLGHVCAGAFVYNSNELAQTLTQASAKSGERIHIFPHFPEISEDIKGNQSDLCNLGAARGMAGSMVGGAFLKEFVEDKAFAHIDIAGTANEINAPGYPKKGGSGYGVQLAVALAESLAL